MHKTEAIIPITTPIIVSQETIIQLLLSLKGARVLFYKCANAIARQRILQVARTHKNSGVNHFYDVPGIQDKHNLLLTRKYRVTN